MVPLLRSWGVVVVLAPGLLLPCLAAEKTVTAPPAPVHWTYTGEEGPEAWGTLSADYTLCAAGKGQSPIDVPVSDSKGSADWRVNYGSTALHMTHHAHVEDIIDNGHTIQVDVDPGNTVSLSGKIFELKQFHFHSPSEHTVNGRHAPMEIHLVHQASDGSFAVLGVLVEAGSMPDPEFAKLVANLPTTKGETRHLPDVPVALESHLPKERAAYHYVGSLTTPPCLEQVQWLVLRQPLHLAKSQIDAIAAPIAPNARPAQALNARQVERVEVGAK